MLAVVLLSYFAGTLICYFKKFKKMFLPYTLQSLCMSSFNPDSIPVSLSLLFALKVWLRLALSDSSNLGVSCLLHNSNVVS